MAERKTLADKARLKEKERARAGREAKAAFKAKALTVGLSCVAVVLAILVGISGYRLYQYRRSADIYDRALKLAAIPAVEDLANYQAGDGNELTGVPGFEGGDLVDGVAPAEGPWAGLSSSPDSYADRFAAMDLAALASENPDVAGWIDIPGTGVSYPYVQCGDNTTYLRKAWDGSPATAGSIIMEPGCPADLTGFNTILYGHNMNDGSMFGVLDDYRDFAFWKDHQTVYLRNTDGVFRYRIYSVRMTSLDDGAFVYGEPNDIDRQTILSGGMELSEIYTGVKVPANARILTLSTCTGMGRYDVRLVAQAVLEWHMDVS